MVSFAQVPPRTAGRLSLIVVTPPPSNEATFNLRPATNATDSPSGEKKKL